MNRLRGQGALLVAAIVVVAWGVLLARPSLAQETICWRNTPGDHWLTISGIPMHGQEVGRPLGTSVLLDRCVTVEIPRPVCVSKLAPWVHALSERAYREACRFDFDGDGIVGLSDLGIAIAETSDRLGTVCSDEQF